MVFNTGFVVFLLVLMFVWLSAISFFLLRMIYHYNTLTKDISVRGLKAILEQILKRQQGLIGKTDELEKVLNETRNESLAHIQKIGLVRFNPFSDTGGSQSFTMALLDNADNGVVMTSLYARTGNRWYVKEIRGAAGVRMELSKEEISAIAQAQSGIK